VVGTSAAVIYDVGYFIGVGMISEHIGFALLALPEVAWVLLVRGQAVPTGINGEFPLQDARWNKSGGVEG
jgi:hypothetical protein